VIEIKVHGRTQQGFSNRATISLMSPDIIIIISQLTKRNHEQLMNVFKK